MKVIRIMFSIVLLLLVVSALVLGALYYFIDPDKLKPVIIAEVKKETGYTLSMEGKLTWRLYPRLAIHVAGMSLTGPGEHKPFANFQDVRMAADVMQLLHGRGALQGEIHIAGLTLMGAWLTKVETVLHWQNNVLSLSPIDASLYQGTLSGTASGHSLSEIPVWDWNLVLNNVQLKSLLADVNPDSKLVVSGTGQLNMQGTTKGKQSNELMSNLNGKLSLQLGNGAINGIDLNYLVKTADALINKQPIPEQAYLSKTDFTSFTGTAVIRNGVATTNDLQFTSPAFMTKGNGDINLLSNTLLMHLLTTPQEQLKTQWSIPILIQGSLDQPDIKVDDDQLSKYVIKDQIDKVKDKARDLIEKHVKGEPGALLQNLLNR